MTLVETSCKGITAPEEMTAPADIDHGLTGLQAAIAHVQKETERLSCAAIGDAVERLVVLRRQLEAVELEALERYRQSMDWSLDGHRTVNAWLRHTCRLPRGSAGRRVALGRKLADMPLTAAAFKAGFIGLDHVDRLGKANRPERASAFAESEHLLVDNAIRMPFMDFVKTVDYFEQLTDIDPDPDPDHDPKSEKRKFHATQLLDGMGRLDGWLEPIGWSAFDKALRKIEKELFNADWAAAVEEHGESVSLDKLTRTPAQRRADALVEMAHRAMTAPKNGKRPEPLVIVHMDNATFKNELNRQFGLPYEFGDERMSELQNGTVITPTQAVQLALQGHVRRMVYDTPGVKVNYGRSARFATGALRQLIEVRDRTCDHQSCDVPATECEIDHHDEWQDGFITEADNLRARCPWHHRWKHKFRITRDETTGETTWSRKDS